MGPGRQQHSVTPSVRPLAAESRADHTTGKLSLGFPSPGRAVRTQGSLFSPQHLEERKSPWARRDRQCEPLGVGCGDSDPRAPGAPLEFEGCSSSQVRCCLGDISSTPFQPWFCPSSSPWASKLEVFPVGDPSPHPGPSAPPRALLGDSGQPWPRSDPLAILQLLFLPAGRRREVPHPERGQDRGGWQKGDSTAPVVLLTGVGQSPGCGIPRGL